MASDKDEFNEIRAVLQKHFLQLKNIFLMAASYSTYPTIAHDAFLEFIEKSDIIDSHTDIPKINQFFNKALETSNKYKHSKERALHRYEFIEVLVYIANHKYRIPDICPTIAEAVERLLVEDIFPRNSPVDGINFRVNHLYDVKVEEILIKNEPVIRKLYNSFGIGVEKLLMTIDDCENLMLRAGKNLYRGLNLRTFIIESMISRVDTLYDVASLKRLRYVEFLAFIGRVSHEICRKITKEEYPLHLEINIILPILL